MGGGGGRGGGGGGGREDESREIAHLTNREIFVEGETKADFNYKAVKRLYRPPVLMGPGASDILHSGWPSDTPKGLRPALGLVSALAGP